ncbi:hypothetical protein PROFUN_03309 [Planoprotostelium fungivorum]|uniref:Uncharacterized protein n=1 Tax=Planoprotostelium fungivorum TaxID=1890364 RepID=A0A2P6NWQ4_9EUKA|nr:hypothetical protein PROFUN_03309 [Planoprotostelium fungivorum]
MVFSTSTNESRQCNAQTLDKGSRKKRTSIPNERRYQSRFAKTMYLIPVDDDSSPTTAFLLLKTI